MEIVIEIGTEEQKSLIESELSGIEDVLEHLPFDVNLQRVIVPVDFEGTIRELSGDPSYSASRGQLTVAKVLALSEGMNIVFSPIIYTIGYDTQIRTMMYLHELALKFYFW